MPISGYSFVAFFVLPGGGVVNKGQHHSPDSYRFLGRILFNRKDVYWYCSSSCILVHTKWWILQCADTNSCVFGSYREFTMLFFPWFIRVKIFRKHMSHISVVFLRVGSRIFTNNIMNMLHFNTSNQFVTDVLVTDYLNKKRKKKLIIMRDLRYWGLPIRRALSLRFSLPCPLVLLLSRLQPYSLDATNMCLYLVSFTRKPRLGII